LSGSPGQPRTSTNDDPVPDSAEKTTTAETRSPSPEGQAQRSIYLQQQQPQIQKPIPKSKAQPSLKPEPPLDQELDVDLDMELPVEETGNAGSKDATELPAPSGSAIIEAHSEALAEERMCEWLTNLDGGRGSMLQYLDAIKSEFDADFAQIRAARLTQPIAPGALGSIEPSFFEVLGVKPVGHRLLFAKGIMALT